jgi:hypothetical protein
VGGKVMEKQLYEVNIDDIEQAIFNILAFSKDISINAYRPLTEDIHKYFKSIKTMLPKVEKNQC